MIQGALRAEDEAGGAFNAWASAARDTLHACSGVFTLRKDTSPFCNLPLATASIIDVAYFNVLISIVKTTSHSKAAYFLFIFGFLAHAADSLESVPRFI
jgi:hypothetical protein